MVESKQGDVDEIERRGLSGFTQKGTKSTIVLDVKPKSADIDFNLMEKAIRNLKFDGVNFGASKIEEIGYGIKKLELMITLDDDKVDWGEVERSILHLKDEVSHSNFASSLEIQSWNKL